MDDQSNKKFEVYNYSGKTNLKGYKKFCSGNSVIDKFVTKGNLKQQALKAPGSGVKVLLDETEAQKLAGFITLTAYSLEREIFKGKVERVGTTRDIPVARLVMLGVDESYQKQGLGIKLMRVAFDSTKVLASALNCSGLYLDADPEAVEFYKKYGFVLLDKPDPLTQIVPMFLHLDSIP